LLRGQQIQHSRIEDNASSLEINTSRACEVEKSMPAAHAAALRRKARPSQERARVRRLTNFIASRYQDVVSKCFKRKEGSFSNVLPLKLCLLPLRLSRSSRSRSGAAVAYISKYITGKATQFLSYSRSQSLSRLSHCLAWKEKNARYLFNTSHLTMTVVEVSARCSWGNILSSTFLLH
jgi:hypothetical protein